MHSLARTNIIRRRVQMRLSISMDWSFPMQRLRCRIARKNTISIEVVSATIFSQLMAGPSNFEMIKQARQSLLLDRLRAEIRSYRKSTTTVQSIRPHAQLNLRWQTESNIAAFNFRTADGK